MKLPETSPVRGGALCGLCVFSSCWLLAGRLPSWPIRTSRLSNWTSSSGRSPLTLRRWRESPMRGNVQRLDGGRHRTPFLPPRERVSCRGAWLREAPRLTERSRVPCNAPRRPARGLFLRFGPLPRSLGATGPTSPCSPAAGRRLPVPSGIARNRGRSSGGPPPALPRRFAGHGPAGAATACLRRPCRAT